MFAISMLVTKFPVVAGILGLVYLIPSLFLFGHFLNKWWGFK